MFKAEIISSNVLCPAPRARPHSIRGRSCLSAKPKLLWSDFWLPFTWVPWSFVPFQVLAERAAGQGHLQVGSLPLWLGGAPSHHKGQGAWAYAAFDGGIEAAARVVLGEAVALPVFPNELLQSQPPTN